MSAGLLVAFLGVDGIGKSTLAKAVTDELRERSVPVRQVSWRSTMAAQDDGWPVDALQELWVETFRLLTGGAGTGLRLPRTYPEWADESWESRLGDTSLAGAGASGPVAAALVELAGNVVLATEVIRPAVARGEVVVLESFPFKHVLKELLIGRATGGDDGPWSELIGPLQNLVEQFFGQAPMAPDVGVLVDGPVEFAYRWRTEQTGQTGILEDYRAAGMEGRDSYLALQTATADVFRRVAARWGWLTHEVSSAGLARDMERGVRTVLGHPSVARLLAPIP